MSARSYSPAIGSNNMRPIDYCFSLTSVAGAASAPTFVEGDGFGGNDVSLVTSTGTYLTITRTGVGVYVITSNDPFPGFVSCGYQMAAATAAGQLNINASPATQNTNNTWTQTLSCFSAAVARELAAGDFIYCWQRYRNGTNTP